MKRFIFTLISVFSITLSYADLNGNGYYRVRNVGSTRWASLIDDQGSVDNVAGTADVHALQLSLNTDDILADPASIVYFTSMGGNQYDLAAQGTSLEQLIDYPVNVMAEESGANGLTKYVVYGKRGSVTKYIGDARTNSSDEYGVATTNPATYPSYKKYRQWYILPVSIDSDNYFGTTPNVTAGGKQYRVLYTSFPYQTYSSGMKAYYIGNVGNGIVEMIEIENGIIPQYTGVIIECAGSTVSENKLNLINSQDPIGGNSLVGVFFDYKGNTYENRVPYDAKTMRVLGKCSDGSLGFITNNKLTSIPANSAYISVPAGSPSEYKCLSPSDFTTSINSINTDKEIALRYSGGYIYTNNNTEIKVYNISGQLVASALSDAFDVSNLPAGIYIAKAGNKSLKISVN